MLRSKVFVTALFAAALGAATGWACFGVLPAKARVNVPTATAVSPPATPAPSQSAQHPIRIDGERSRLPLESEDTGLRAEKPGVTLRTPVGNFDLRW
jgi:hypothetical protein